MLLNQQEGGAWGILPLWSFSVPDPGLLMGVGPLPKGVGQLPIGSLGWKQTSNRVHGDPFKKQ